MHVLIIEDDPLLGRGLEVEAQRFVEARKGEDKRATHLYLTWAGRKAMQPALIVRRAAVKGYLGVSTAAEEKEFARLLEKLIAPASEGEVSSKFRAS